MYYAAVSILESHGYSSARSEPLDMLFFYNEINPAANASDDSGSSSHVYVAVAVGVVIAIALGASLVFLLIRHRRLQRSFVNFANTHWSGNSGGVTFSDQDQTLGKKTISAVKLDCSSSVLNCAVVEEEDSPVIRGFSDDEPLVIA